MMVNKLPTRRELLDRWRGIEEEDDDYNDSFDSSRRHRLRQLKEEWFSDVFNRLVYSSKELHIWCASWDLMGPLLETFYNYLKDQRDDSPLKLLWKRISEELRLCIQCTCQHHQAQEMYNTEYESNSIGPLLDILRTLDEERVTQHLKEINLRIARGEYDPVCDNAEVITVMFEVLMFPALLDDDLLVTEFQIFIEAIDDSHELTLAGHQQYPGVFALLFLKSRRVRSIGLRLAGCVGKLRKATDLEPLQPLLRKCIGLLEIEVVPSGSETSRPRLQLERTSVWLGMKALLGFLEPPAFEEGILERHPIFLSIVLNHITDDSLEFSHAVNCLRLLFEMLGCKLWLRATLSPSVMRNSLLSQCFHTRNEKNHKEIFDLFQPFLQSLEALQDGEHEKERRYLLYFLLHQVPVSRNFSDLMRKKACQIAIRIIHHGYKMNPPCPPFECAHMWGPSLVSCLKDLSLHNSLRQPAFDLIQTITVSDAAALVTSILNCNTLSTVDRNMLVELNGEDDDEGPLCDLDVEEKDTSCWNEFGMQSKTTSQEYGRWMCIPMLWFDVLVEIDPSVLPVSFSKAVFWALSRFSMVESESSAEMALPVRNWLTTYASEISHLFGWKVPSGSDDGEDGKKLKNSIEVSTMCILLIKTFKRFTAHFVVRMEQAGLCKQWTWEPKMGESLILLLVDPNDNARQVARLVLEQVSNVRGLACGLQFLCSCPSGQSALFLGLRHALKLVQLDSVLLRFQILHHFFFVLCKLFKEGNICPRDFPGNSSNDLNISILSSHGGFLRQPSSDSMATHAPECLSDINSDHWDKFSCLLAETAWRPILKCLAKGKASINYKISQMTCIRLLEIVPVVYERLQQSVFKVSAPSGMMAEVIDVSWLHDLMDWRKSSLAVVVRYWKQTAFSLLDMLKVSCGHDSASAISAIEKLISCENVAMDELNEQVKCLSFSFRGTNIESIPLSSTDLLHVREHSIQDQDPPVFEDMDVQILDSTSLVNKERDEVVIILDDEKETEVCANNVVQPHVVSSQCLLDGKIVSPSDVDKEKQKDPTKENASRTDTTATVLESFCQTVAPNSTDFVPLTLDSDIGEGRLVPSPSIKSKVGRDKKRETNMKSDTNDLKKLAESVCCTISESYVSQPISTRKNSSDQILSTGIIDLQCINKDSSTNETVIKELVCNAEENPCESELKSVRRQCSSANKTSSLGTKRQVIQLNYPMENRSVHLHRLDDGVKRFRPPRLDDWYRPILEMDYFTTVGFVSANVGEVQAFGKLREVPISFKSPDEYIDIFKPLVLEEFRAQLHSSFMEMASLEEMHFGYLSVMSVERIDDFHIARCVHDDANSAGSKSCLENDLILLTRQPLRNSADEIHIVGKVEKRDKYNKKGLNILNIRFYLQNGSSRVNRVRKLLIDRSKWYISRLMNITPQLREFQALSSLKDIPLLPTILNPISHVLCRYESGKHLNELSRPLCQIFKSTYNDCQLQAINAVIQPLTARKNFELSLIQGPPGTGKTRTIVAIVSCLLAFSQMNKKKKSLNSGLKLGNNSLINKLQMSQSAAIARAWQDAALARQLSEDDRNKSRSTMNFIRGRVLICAQSNAAVDELVARISSYGLYDNDGEMYKPYLVRVGNAKTIHPSSLPFFIDTLVDQRLAGKMDCNDSKNDVGADSLRPNLENLVDRIRFYETKRANLRDRNTDMKCLLEGEAYKGLEEKEMSDAEIEAKLRKLYEEKKAIYRDLAAAQAREKKANEESKAAKYKLRKAILREAEIVVTTLSGCGGDLYGACFESFLNHKFGSSSDTLFDAVVIDEAAQALEPATLIPLQLLKSKGARCIMVGDPKQLPATVLSEIASRYQYQCSMFERLQRAGYPVIMLTKQYRMHPEICHFPSLHFYDSKLINGEQMSNRAAPFHRNKFLGPYLFFDVNDGQEFRGKNSGALSLYNECEADTAVELLRFFRTSYPSEFVGGRIGIITPYKCQLSLLRSRFSSAFGSSVTDEMEFNTVDGFQGREVDILLLSTVRATKPSTTAASISSKNIGFVADVRRMNVALTRAKFSLWILGNVKTLQTNKSWAALVKDAEERNLVISIKKPYEFIFKSALIKNFMPNNSNHKYSTKTNHMEGSVAAERHGELRQTKTRNTNKRKRKYNGNAAESNDTTSGNDHDILTSSETLKSGRRKDKDERAVLEKKHPASIVVENTATKAGKVVESASMDDKVYVQSRGNRNREKQVDVGNTCVADADDPANIRNKLDLSEQVMDTGHKPSQSASLKGLAEHFENHKGQQNIKIDTSSKDNLQKLDGNSRLNNQVKTPKDEIMRRKQQRDAVDALLCSALIPSKSNRESSSRSVSMKKTTTSTSGHPIKPPKARHVSSSSSSGLMLGKTHRSCCKEKSFSSEEIG